jgi:hypothetical protein
MDGGFMGQSRLPEMDLIVYASGEKMLSLSGNLSDLFLHVDPVRYFLDPPVFYVKIFFRNIIFVYERNLLKKIILHNLKLNN